MKTIIGKGILDDITDRERERERERHGLPVIGVRRERRIAGEVGIECLDRRKSIRITAGDGGRVGLAAACDGRRRVLKVLVLLSCLPCE